MHCAMWWYISPPPGVVALTFPYTRSLELATGCIGSWLGISDTYTSQLGQHWQLCQHLDWLNRQQQDSSLGLPCATTGEHDSVVLQQSGAGQELISWPGTKLGGIQFCSVSEHWFAQYTSQLIFFTEQLLDILQPDTKAQPSGNQPTFPNLLTYSSSRANDERGTLPPPAKVLYATEANKWPWKQGWVSKRQAATLHTPGLQLRVRGVMSMKLFESTSTTWEVRFAWLTGVGVLARKSSHFQIDIWNSSLLATSKSVGFSSAEQPRGSENCKQIHPLGGQPVRPSSTTWFQQQHPGPYLRHSKDL